jgi:fatty-acyl-CoA synthase
VLAIDVDRFQTDGVVVAPADGANRAEHVACGAAFEGHEVAVLGPDGTWLGDGREGELCLKGPSVTSGYYGNPKATAECFRADGWLRTGDLGFVCDGQIYVTGRIKDLIIVNGRNVHPQSIEWAVAEVEGVRRGNVVAFSVPGQDSEDVVIVVETRGEVPGIHDAIQRVVQKELSLTVADIVCLPSGSLPKTSSGKLQRRRTRQDYLAGKLGLRGPRTAGSAARSLSLARHFAASIWERAKAATLGTGPARVD